MNLLSLLRTLKRSFSPYTPSVQIFISKPNLLYNLHEYQTAYPHLAFAPVLKSNAYGHGLVQIAQILDNQNISFFVVDSLYEAILLRHHGIKSEILVIGYTSAENINHSKLKNVAFTITSLEQLQQISQTITSPTNFHLKIDTGMHRQGLLPNQIDDAITILKSPHSPLILTGICSHFADADGKDDKFTKSQITIWNKIVSQLTTHFPQLKFIHISNTAGTCHSNLNKKPGNPAVRVTRGGEPHGRGPLVGGHGAAEWQDPHPPKNRKIFQTDFPGIPTEVARLGLGLYGINPSPSAKTLNLKPVLHMQSIITSIKTIPAGEFVGYNITHQTKKTTTIATVPLGYFEGIDRRLSNRGFFKINHHFCPIIGRVSMNIATIDVASVPNLKLGDPVTIISNKPQDKNSIENMARLAHTIPYEILVHLPQHLRRIIVD